MSACGSNANSDKDLETHAKCASKVIDAKTGSPVKNLEVYILLDDNVYKYFSFSYVALNIAMKI